MASIELRDISHSYDAEKKGRWFRKAEPSEENWSVTDLSITWEDGSANALLGPSGCGKTTLLNLISGIIKPTRGRVYFDGKDVTDLSPEERHLAQVFQFPVVYDSMDVFGNLAFPLRNDGWAEKLVAQRVEEIALLLDLKADLKRGMASLTPAEKQKISLGRGLVRPNTAAVLLDEPLTVIDPKQQWELRRKLRLVQRQLKMTMIYVTHDQHEALTFADRTTVMSKGRISQTGTPEELHNDPASPFIGFFIGSPGMNILDCAMKDGQLDFGAFSLPATPGIIARIGSRDGGFQFGIRPESIEVSAVRREGWAALTLITAENIGAYKVFTLEKDGVRIKARVPEIVESAEGSTVWVTFPEGQAKLFVGEARIDK